MAFLGRPSFFSARFNKMYCSPAHLKEYQNTGSCFKRDQLLELAEAWNRSHPDRPITGLAKKTKAALWQDLNARMAGLCSGAVAEVCWANRLAPFSKTVAPALRPRKPVDWEDNPYEWLTNYDIEAVMKQYAEDPKQRYQFTGVFPIDFQTAKSGFGQCLYQQICNIQLKNLKVPYVGMITNLDRHNQSGSHWTSLFMVVDPKHPAYGAYYYDSVARPPPKEIIAFVKSLNQQYKAAGNPQMRLLWNKKRHQYANTECGVFAMAFQIRWLNALNAPGPVAPSFKSIINIDIRDDDIHKLRDMLYRP